MEVLANTKTHSEVGFGRLFDLGARFLDDIALRRGPRRRPIVIHVRPLASARRAGVPPVGPFSEQRFAPPTVQHDIREEPTFSGVLRSSVRTLFTPAKPSEIEKAVLARVSRTVDFVLLLPAPGPGRKEASPRTPEEIGRAGEEIVKFTRVPEKRQIVEIVAVSKHTIYLRRLRLRDMQMSLITASAHYIPLIVTRPRRELERTPPARDPGGYITIRPANKVSYLRRSAGSRARTRPDYE
ncbi:hypothetical protein EVAR_45842_1 [Eumeta japonica]|uniref:Uncharacterized protein n=1 Tax=Eumeta variegata TaxID=151549 RepID=A0A4C1WLV2_EUMVA|nr:hypothetical protein EVAR_45842_1 [Eumeta japonica]